MTPAVGVRDGYSTTVTTMVRILVECPVARYDGPSREPCHLAYGRDKNAGYKGSETEKIVSL